MTMAEVYGQASSLNLLLRPISGSESTSSPSPEQGWPLESQSLAARDPHRRSFLTVLARRARLSAVETKSALRMLVSALGSSSGRSFGLKRVRSAERWAYWRAIPCQARLCERRGNVNPFAPGPMLTSDGGNAGVPGRTARRPREMGRRGGSDEPTNDGPVIKVPHPWRLTAVSARPPRPSSERAAGQEVVVGMTGVQSRSMGITWSPSAYV